MWGAFSTRQEPALARRRLPQASPLSQETPPAHTGTPARPLDLPSGTSPMAEEPVPLSEPLPFPVVGAGASAGGLEAFTQLLRTLPVDTGMAFVLVQHLDPTHTSLLTDILSRATKMPVQEVAADTRV